MENTVLKYLLCYALIPLFSTTTLSCHQKHIEERTVENQDHITFDNHFNSLIEGKIIRRYRKKEAGDEIYQDHDAYAQVKIVEILRNGQNYHGQFNEGDTIDVFFSFTLDNTKEIFPELNYVFGGLKEMDNFQAELIEKRDGDPRYRVNEYKYTGR